MNLAYDIQAPKKATNLSINADLLKKAKSYKINLSKSFEAYLNELIKEYEKRQWQQESVQAIKEYNERVKQWGAFSDGLRRF